MSAKRLTILKLVAAMFAQVYVYPYLHSLISTCYVTGKSRNAKNKFVYSHVRLYAQSSQPFRSDSGNLVLQFVLLCH